MFLSVKFCFYWLFARAKGNVGKETDWRRKNKRERQRWGGGGSESGGERGG